MIVIVADQVDVPRIDGASFSDASKAPAQPMMLSVEMQREREPTIINALTPVETVEELNCGVPVQEGPPPAPIKGRRPDPFKRAAFRETVFILARSLIDVDAPQAQCSGTIISAEWVLTAGHCFMWTRADGENAALSKFKLGPRGYSAIRTDARDDIFLFPETGKGLTNDTKSTEVVVHPGYSGGPNFIDDLALVHIKPLPLGKLKITPAVLQPASSPQPQSGFLVTLAGYGVFNAPDAEIWQVLEIAFPPGLDVTMDPPRLQYPAGSPTPDLQHQGAFCSGDSGGPVFTGRVRGCPTEASPRPIAGVISNLDAGSDNPNTDQCKRAKKRSMTSLLVKSTRQFVCRVVGTTAAGCN